MRYRVVLEYDPESRHYTATVPGLPGIVCDAKSEREALRLVREGIALYQDEFAPLLRASMERLKALWDNPYDEMWNHV